MCQKRPVFIFISETPLAWLSNGLSSWPIDRPDLFAGGDNKDNYHLVLPKASDIFLCLLNNICNFYFYLNVYIFCQRIAVLCCCLCSLYVLIVGYLLAWWYSCQPTWITSLIYCYSIRIYTCFIVCKQI